MKVATGCHFGWWVFALIKASRFIRGSCWAETFMLLRRIISEYLGIHGLELSFATPYIPCLIWLLCAPSYTTIDRAFVHAINLSFSLVICHSWLLAFHCCSPRGPIKAPSYFSTEVGRCIWSSSLGRREVFCRRRAEAEITWIGHRRTNDLP